MVGNYGPHVDRYVQMIRDQYDPILKRYHSMKDRAVEAIDGLYQRVRQAFDMEYQVMAPQYAMVRADTPDSVLQANFYAAQRKG